MTSTEVQEEILGHKKSIKQFVQTVGKNAKCLLNQQRVSRFIAEIVSRSIKSQEESFNRLDRLLSLDFFLFF